MLHEGMTIRGPCRAGARPAVMVTDEVRRLLALHEGERESERARTERLMALIERQERLLTACRQQLGRETYEAIRQRVERV